MIRAAVLTTVLSLVGGPLGPVVCLVWCSTDTHAESTHGESCHRMTRALHVSVAILGDSCDDSLPLTPFVREERRWEPSRAVALQALTATRQAVVDDRPVATARIVGHVDLPLMHPSPPVVLRL